MGLSTAYYTVDGEIIGESSNGVRLDYLSDALGSITGKVDQVAAVSSTARYKPHGDKLSGHDYTFGWVGSYGYRKGASGFYVRSRHLESNTSWSSQDGLWPKESPYAYVSGHVTTMLDPSGFGMFYTASRRLSRHEEAKCGNFDVGWHFWVTPSLTATGWLIQEITQNAKITPCKPPSESSYEDCPHFFELWLVIKGEVYQPHTYQDGQQWVPFKTDTQDYWTGLARPCTHGSYQVKASLTFVPDMFANMNGPNLWPILHGFNRKNSVPCSNFLPSTRDFVAPPGSFWESRAFYRDEWKCCKAINSCFNPPNCQKCEFTGPCSFKDTEILFFHP